MEAFTVMPQMRDLRRYASPVIVQNAGQVNIASDGGQQVNVQKSKRRAKTGSAKTNGKRVNKTKPKQLSSKSAEECVKINRIEESVSVE